MVVASDGAAVGNVDWDYIRVGELKRLPVLPGFDIASLETLVTPRQNLDVTSVGGVFVLGADDDEEEEGALAFRNDGIEVIDDAGTVSVARIKVRGVPNEWSISEVEKNWVNVVRCAGVAVTLAMKAKSGVTKVADKVIKDGTFVYSHRRDTAQGKALYVVACFCCGYSERKVLESMTERERITRLIQVLECDTGKGDRFSEGQEWYGACCAVNQDLATPKSVPDVTTARAARYAIAMQIIKSACFRSFCNENPNVTATYVRNLGNAMKAEAVSTIVKGNGATKEDDEAMERDGENEDDDVVTAENRDDASDAGDMVAVNVKFEYKNGVIGLYKDLLKLRKRKRTNDRASRSRKKDRPQVIEKVELMNDDVEDDTNMNIEASLTLTLSQMDGDDELGMNE